MPPPSFPCAGVTEGVFPVPPALVPLYLPAPPPDPPGLPISVGALLPLVKAPPDPPPADVIPKALELTPSVPLFPEGFGLAAAPPGPPPPTTIG